MPTESEPIGPIIVYNLHRLGWVHRVTPCGEIAEQVAKSTGRRVSRQRISAITKAEHVESETLEWLAKGLGTTVKELTRKPPKSRPR